MKEKIADRILKLFEVKSLVTFGIIGTVIYLACKGTIESKDMVLFAGIIMTYFFTKDNNKSTPAV
jgi:hypothetical protein